MLHKVEGGGSTGARIGAEQIFFCATLSAPGDDDRLPQGKSKEERDIVRRQAIAGTSVIPPDRDRIAQALHALTEADLVRLRRIAQLRARALPDMQWTDLLNEAVLRALNGTRHWPESVPVIVFLAGVMRSLAEEQWRQHRARVALFQPRFETGNDADDDPADASPGPEREVHAQRCLSAIDSLFCRDEDALQVIAGLSEGLSAAAIQRKYAMDATRYATTRRRIRRILLRTYAGRDWK
jgi:RNA polymerase sigma-70 factor (ECF subfamily)